MTRWEEIENISLADYVWKKTRSGLRDFLWARTAELPNLPLLRQAIQAYSGLKIG